MMAVIGEIEFFVQLPNDSPIIRLEQDDDGIIASCEDGTEWLIDDDGRVTMCPLTVRVH